MIVFFFYLALSHIILIHKWKVDVYHIKHISLMSAQNGHGNKAIGILLLTCFGVCLVSAVSVKGKVSHPLMEN